jgi:hypothetical protein
LFYAIITKKPIFMLVDQANREIIEPAP